MQHTAESSSSLGGSPQTPLRVVEKGHEQNINELISQYSSNPKSTINPNGNTKTNNNVRAQEGPKNHSSSIVPQHPAKLQTPSLGSPTKVTKLVSNGSTGGNGPVINTVNSRQGSDDPTSEASEGEIIEDPKPKKSSPTTEFKQSPATSKQIKAEEQITRRQRDDTLSKRSYKYGSREESPSDRTFTDANNREDRCEESKPHLGNRQHESDDNEQRTDRPTDKQPYSRREAHDLKEGHRKTDTFSEHNRKITMPSREIQATIPTLEQILPHDRDLREWLEITAYHNGPYRDKILKRRRAIAALDAQKNALLAEMEAEERGSLLITGAIPSNSTMLPPPMPAQSVTRADTLPVAEAANLNSQRGRLISNKRAYSELQDGHDDGVSGKILRRNDHGARILEGDGTELRRSRSSGYDSSYRALGDRRFERDRTPNQFYGRDDRGPGQDRSRNRDISPVLSHFENRSLIRTRRYDSGSDDYDEQDDRDPRPFEVRGAYRGRAFDPHYRGRGRGRGRGEQQGHLELRSDSAPSTSYGSRIATSKPFKVSTYLPADFS